MTYLTLNCPTCRRQLVYVPLDGLTLHYRCIEHGLFIFKPLHPIEYDAATDFVGRRPTHALHTHDAA